MTTESVWQSWLFQGLLLEWQINISSVDIILSVSVLTSQLISNVQLIALFQPMLLHAGTTLKELKALAAGRFMERPFLHFHILNFN